MSFSFRNLFSQEAPNESFEAGSGQAAVGGGRGGMPGEMGWSGGNGGFGGAGGSDRHGAGDGAVFRPNPQPTDIGNFTAMFGEPESANRVESERVMEWDFQVGEILPLIPPALVSRENLGLDERLRIRMPGDGSRGVKLSRIYAVCPRLFATPITALNDSTIVLPAPRGRVEGFAGGAMAGGGDTLIPARETGGLPGPRNGESGQQSAGENPFWRPPGESAEAPWPAPAGPAGDGFSGSATKPGDQHGGADAAAFAGFGFGTSPSGQAGAPGGFFGAASEPAPGAEHLGQPDRSFGGGGGFGFPEGQANPGAPNPFAGDSFSGGGGNQPKSADWGFGAAGEAGLGPQDMSPAGSPPEHGFFSSAGASGAFGGGSAPVPPMVFGQDREPARAAVQPAVGAWKEAGVGRTIDLRLRDLFSRQAVQMTGIDPMGIPQDAMVRIPVSCLESQSATGSFSLKLSELAALAEPVAAAVLMRGNPDARIALPVNDLFRQAGQAGTFPAPDGGPWAPPQHSGDIPVAGGFETLFSQGAKSDAALSPGFGAAVGGSEAPSPASNPFLQSAGEPSYSFPPASFAEGRDPGHNPFAAQNAGAESGPAQADLEGYTAFLPPRVAGAPAVAATEAPAASVGPEAGSHVFQAAGSFLEELEDQAEGVPPVPVPRAAEAARRPARAERAPMPDPVSVRDIELRAVFGTSEAFTLQRVADLTNEMSGVASCFVCSPLGSAQAPHAIGQNRRQEQADSILRGVRELARITGVENAETFTMHTDYGVVSVFMHGEACLTIRHERGDFEPGVREKLILVARGVSLLRG